MSKQNNIRLLLDIKETILIKNSEAAKDHEIYGNLYAALQRYYTLSKKDLEISKSFDKKALAALGDDNVKRILLDNIKQEWDAVELCEDSDKTIPCQLCHTPNKKVYFIRNRLNKNELNVGSDCVKDYLNGLDLKIVRRNFNERERTRKQEIRRVEFAELESEDPEFISRIRNDFNNLDIVLPYSLNNSISQIIYDLSFIKTNYIQQGGEFIEISSKYNLLKNEYLKLWEQAIDHYQRNSKNKLACKKYIADWLKEKHFKIWEDITKDNGLFTIETLKFAYESKYVKKHLSDFSKHLKDNGIKIIDVNGNSVRFMIQDDKYRNPVYFFVSTKIFMEQIGRYCLTQRDYYFTRYNLKEINIDDYPNNLDALFNRMMEPMHKAGLSLEIGEHSKQLYYKRLPRVIEKSNWTDKVKKCELGYKKIATGYYFNICNDLLLKTDDAIEKAFKLILHKLEMGATKWLTQAEIHEQEQITKDLAMKQQKEFI